MSSSASSSDLGHARLWIVVLETNYWLCRCSSLARGGCVCVAIHTKVAAKNLGQ